MLYCLLHHAVVIDASVVEVFFGDHSQTVSEIRYDDDQPNYWGGGRRPCRHIGDARGFGRGQFLNAIKDRGE